MGNYAEFAFIVFLLYTVTRAAVGSDVTPKNNYTVLTNGGIACVVMTAAIQLTIPYIGQNKNLTATINIPTDAKSTGLCSPGRDTISVYFNQNWQLSITIRNTSDSAYQWQKVSLTYTQDGAHFPNISSQNVDKSIIVDTTLPDGTMRIPIGGSSSYTCALKLLQLNNSITMNISSLQYRAFGKDNSTKFTSSGIQKCSVTMAIPATDVTLAVSIGIGLGVMMVLVILIYIVFSKVIERFDKEETG